MKTLVMPRGTHGAAMGKLSVMTCQVVFLVMACVSEISLR